WRGISKEGDWGTAYGEYYKEVRGGRTIKDDLPKNMKWMALTVEVLTNIISDPVIGPGVIANMLKAKIPKHFIGKLPPTIQAFDSRQLCL
ncbi:unnamed protein product, partial [marine sediment metagenome]